MSSGAAVADLPLALQARSDLVVRPQMFRGRRYWCVKDPVSLAYFHLRDEEYTVLRSLDGRTTTGGLIAMLAARFPGFSHDAEQIRGFLGTLLRNGLVTADVAGQGGQLWTRHRAARRRKWLAALPGLLSIRFRGIDPHRPLRLLFDCLWWIFSPWFLGAAAAAVFAALIAVCVRFDSLGAEFADATAYFTPRNATYFFLTLGAIKVLHEIGHGLACIRYGGECHEMGLMFLVFAPCLYCDVSDTWLLPDKWRRIAVAAAGIAVELVLAAAAAFGWMLSEPGAFHAMCLNVMLICSVNTLLFNGNPLLRYDGYFVLSDLIEIPNLATEARGAVSRALFGRESGEPGWLERREMFLLAYGIAAAAYRVFVTFAIAWICLKLLTPLGLAPVGYVLATMCALGLIAAPAVAVARAATGPAPRRARALWAIVVLGGLIGAIAAVPLPHRVEAPALLRARDAARVYARVGGAVLEALPPGSNVGAGDGVGRLENRSLAWEAAELETRLAELTAQLANLENRRNVDPALAGQIPATKQAVEATAAQLAQRRSDLEDLRLMAPQAGMVLPPPDRAGRDVEDELSDWSGSPLESRNLGCHLEPGTLFCLVGDPAKIEAILFVEEGDVEFLRPGQPVQLVLEQTMGEKLSGVVEEIAADPLREAPPELTRGGLLPVRQSDDGSLLPVETVYEVRVKLEDVEETPLRMRGTGRAKVSVGSDRLAERGYRFLRRTFRFDL